MTSACTPTGACGCQLRMSWRFRRPTRRCLLEGTWFAARTWSSPQCSKDVRRPKGSSDICGLASRRVLDLGSVRAAIIPEGAPRPKRPGRAQKKPRLFGGGAHTVSHRTTRLIAVSLRPGAGKNSTEDRPFCTGVSRHHEHLLLAAGTLELSSGLLQGQRVSSRTTVPDNHNKLAIVVTRARADYPSFLRSCLSTCALHASLKRAR